MGLGFLFILKFLEIGLAGELRKNRGLVGSGSRNPQGVRSAGSCAKRTQPRRDIRKMPVYIFSRDDLSLSVPLSQTERHGSGDAC